MKKVVIIGAGGFGRETLDAFDACNQVNPEYDVLYVICSLGAPHHRRRLVEMARQVGARFCSVVHPTAILKTGKAGPSGMPICYL